MYFGVNFESLNSWMVSIIKSLIEMSCSKIACWEDNELHTGYLIRLSACTMEIHFTRQLIGHSVMLCTRSAQNWRIEPLNERQINKGKQKHVNAMLRERKPAGENW